MELHHPALPPQGRFLRGSVVGVVTTFDSKPLYECMSAPMDDAANYVGVAAFFRNTADAEWSVLIPKSQWKKTDPVRLVAADRNLEMETGRR